MKTQRLLVCALVALVCSSCLKNVDGSQLVIADGAFVLNEGSFQKNNTNLSFYDKNTQEVIEDVFFTSNNQPLGDTGQSMCQFNGEIFVSVYGSGCIYVIGPDAKIRSTLHVKKDGVNLSPRYFAKSAENVFVSFYEGFVGKINPASSYTMSLAKTGLNPEGLAYTDGKLFVAVSGGMSATGPDSTVIVYDAAKMAALDTIVVNVNPKTLVAAPDGRHVFVTSLGDYYMKPAKLQSIDVMTGRVLDMDYEAVSGIALGKNGDLNILCSGYDSNWQPLPGTIYTFDCTSMQKKSKFTQTVEKPYSISVGELTGNVYVGSSDYVNNGKVHVFDALGSYVGNFDSAGISPNTVVESQYIYFK